MRKESKDVFCTKIPKIENILELFRDSLFMPLNMLY